MVEFYGATEGNGGLLNISPIEQRESRGCVGHYGSLLRRFLGYTVVKFDINTELPVRNEAGFCEECGSEEVGELLMPIKKYMPHTT